MNHHPSCRPNDTSLIWHCHQCGEKEDASEVFNLLEKIGEEECETTCKFLSGFSPIIRHTHRCLKIKEVIKPNNVDKDIKKNLKENED